MLLSDIEIKALCTGDQPMLTPVYLEKRNTVDGTPDSPNVPSYGLNSYGYDIRIRPNAKVRVVLDSVFGVLDPLCPDDRNFSTLRTQIDEKGRRFVVLPAHASVLTVAEPYFHMPADVTGEVTGKSTYARNFIVPHVTPLEAGWRGDLTLEFTNLATIPSVLYLDGGVCQILFHRGTPCETTYKGNYQDQVGITLGQVKNEQS